MAPKGEINIREAQADDIPAIVDLWLPRKRDPEVFKWLHQNADGTFRSFVADVNGRIVGHIGYVKADYAFQGQLHEGVFSIEWLVDDKFKQAALPLYSKVLKIGQFTFVIGGTEIVNKMYPLMKFKAPLYVSRFLKVTKPMTYFGLLKNPPLKKLVKTVYYSRGLIRRPSFALQSDISLKAHNNPYDYENLSFDTSVAENDASPDYMEWLLNVPGVSATHFSIFQKKHQIGKALCYIEKSGDIFTGRIVHISFLGNEIRVWRDVLKFLEDYLKKSGCCIITAMASHPYYIQALNNSGFVYLRQSPFWLRDRKDLFKEAEWHLTYLEGDLAYRNLYLPDFKFNA